LEIAPDHDLRGFAAMVNTRFIAYNEQSPAGEKVQPGDPGTGTSVSGEDIPF
jgi:hypothetical protein